MYRPIYFFCKSSKCFERLIMISIEVIVHKWFVEGLIKTTNGSIEKRSVLVPTILTYQGRWAAPA